MSPDPTPPPAPDDSLVISGSVSGPFVTPPNLAGGPPPKNRFEPVDSQERIADLVAQLRETVDKLARDASSRGDLKILSRTLRELRYAFKVFAPYRGRRKVTVFGSARTSKTEPAYLQGQLFGQVMAEQKWLVVTGAGNGIMEAAHVGAGRESSMGINIMLPFEQSANEVIRGDEKLVHMKYFFTRKLMFVKECDAVCCLPGGFGTIDEALEVLTLLQTGKRDMVPVVLLDEPGGSFWKDFVDFIRRRQLDAKLISPEDMSLFLLTDDARKAVDEVVRFFSNYHSMRYVRNKLVFRLQRSPTEAELATINDQFSSILAEGKFELWHEPLEEERDEVELAKMTRLVFRFNRRNFGRLRQLIDFLNKLPAAA
jgi:uncharacterized protein (TIGR00730 family)